MLWTLDWEGGIVSVALRLGGCSVDVELLRLGNPVADFESSVADIGLTVVADDSRVPSSDVDSILSFFLGDDGMSWSSMIADVMLNMSLLRKMDNCYQVDQELEPSK